MPPIRDNHGIKLHPHPSTGSFASIRDRRFAQWASWCQRWRAPLLTDSTKPVPRADDVW